MLGVVTFSSVKCYDIRTVLNGSAQETSVRITGFLDCLQPRRTVKKTLLYLKHHHDSSASNQIHVLRLACKAFRRWPQSLAPVLSSPSSLTVRLPHRACSIRSAISHRTLWSLIRMSLCWIALAPPLDLSVLLTCPVS